MSTTFISLFFQLAKWWEEYAYLVNREPPPIVSMAGPSPYVFSYWPPADRVQFRRAGLAMWTAMMYWQLLFQ